MHTPGPWYEAGTGNQQGLVISEATSANVALAYDKKDAALIAASPELLAELEKSTAVLQWYLLHYGNSGGAEYAIQSNESAIAKATGGKP